MQERLILLPFVSYEAVRLWWWGGGSGVVSFLKNSSPLFDSDPRLQLKPFIYRGFMRVGSQSFTGIFT